MYHSDLEQADDCVLAIHIKEEVLESFLAKAVYFQIISQTLEPKKWSKARIKSDVYPQSGPDHDTAGKNYSGAHYK